MKVFCAAMLALCVAVTAVADDDEEEDPPPLQIQVGASLIQASGNTSAFTAGGHASIKYTGKPYSAAVEGSYLRVQGDESVSNEKAAADVALERKIGDLVAPYTQLSYKRDVQSGLDRQASVEIGTALNFVNEEKKWFKLAVALSATDERQTTAADRFLGSNARVKQRWPIGANLALGHTASLLWSFENGRDWRLDNSTSLSVTISRLFALEVSHEANYRHLPALGKKPLDMTSLVSLVAIWPAKTK